MDKIFEWIARNWDAIKLFQIVDPDEGGVHLRKGHYLRTLAEGVWWKLPIIDSFSVTNTAIRCESLLTQTIDGKVVSTGVRFRIKDPRPYLLELGDDDDYLQNVTLSLVLPAIERRPRASSGAIADIVRPELRKAVNKFGFQIYDVFFIDFGETPSVRLIMDSMES